MKKQIIISGGGIAGLTAARLLQRQGHQIVVLDRAKEFTQTGFLLSLKSFGVRIMEELSLTGPLRKASTPAEFMEFVDAQGTLIRRIRYEKMNETLEQSITLTRGGLHQVIYDAVKHTVDILLDTSIEAVQQQDQKVSVTLSNNKVLEADMLIVSEGLRSTTRERYFEHASLEDFPVFYMGGRLNKKHAYPVGSFKTFIDIHQMLSIYPIGKDELAIQCYIDNTDEVSSLQSNARQLLQKTFKHYPPEVQEVIADFQRSGLIFADRMGMVHAPNLVNGRLILLGDAGYCPTALSGMGASLSIYGAKALAHFIDQSPHDSTQALSRYNALMQPIIEKFQRNARNNAASFLPRDETSLRQFASSFRAALESEVHKRLTDQLLLTQDQMNFILN